MDPISRRTIQQRCSSRSSHVFRQDGVVAMRFRDGDADLDRCPPNPDAGAECLEFDRPLANTDLSPYFSMLPERYSIQRMNRTLLQQSPKHEENLDRYGSLENFLSKGAAIGIVHNDQIVCEAYADMEIMGRREIGVGTREAYPGRGLATMTCAHLVRLCQESGSRTYWDSAIFNAGSVALARKLGFQNERAYKLLAWFKPRN